MNAYTTFAQVYDLFMDNVPYEEWSKYIISVLKEYGIHSGVICDLGCGTGKMRSRFVGGHACDCKWAE